MRNGFVKAVIILAIATSTACGKSTGGGGSTGPSATVAVTVTPSSIQKGETATVSAVPRNASNCVTSGDWKENGPKDPSKSYTEVAGPFDVDVTKKYTMTCDGVATTTNLLVGKGSPSTGGVINSATSSDGKVTVTVVQRVPATGPLVPGQPQILKVLIDNDSDNDLHLSFDLFGGGPLIPAHTKGVSSTQGSSSGSMTGSVPVVQLSGKYGSSSVPAWTMSITGWP